MPDFRVADTAPEHPKLRAVGLAAVGLWATAGAYAMRELTDGWVPEYWVLTWPSGKAQAAKLVSVGLWRREPRKGIAGYGFHDWTDYQRPAEKIAKERAEARERMAKLRAGKQSGSQDVRPNTGHMFDRTEPERSANVHDSLPLSLQGGPVDHSGASPERANANSAPAEIPFPDGWTPHDGHQRTATRKRIDLTHEAQQFEAHARAHGRYAVDWDAAFTVWLGSSKPGGRTPWPVRGSANGTDANIEALMSGGTARPDLRAIGGS